MKLPASARKERATIIRKTKELEAATSQIEKALDLIQIEANYSKRLEPLLYVLKLILGIVFAIISLAWILHMYCI